MSPARRASIAERLLASAEDELPSGADFYSWQHIEARSLRASADIEAHIARVAAHLGVPMSEVRSSFDELYERADTRSAGVEAPAEWAVRFRSDGDNGVIPGDRATLYALHEIHARADLATPSATRPLRVAPQGTHRNVARVGYDRASGRLDVELADGWVQTFANVPASVYEEMTSPSANVDSIYYTRVRSRRGGPAAVARAGSAQDRQRCADCGQFCDAGHTCPSPGAVNGPSGAVPVTMPASQPEAPAPGPGPATTEAPRLIMAPTRRHDGADFSMVIASRADIGAFASEHPEFDLPVAAQADDGSGLVTGTVRVCTNATGALAVRRGDLECSCGAAPEAGCAHSQGTLTGVAAYLAGRRGEHSLARTSMAVGDMGQPTHTGPEGPGTEVGYLASSAAFQADYNAAKERIAAGQPAVVFRPEGGVTGGAAAPGRRGFGIEIEFACPAYASRQAIARELYEAGLARQPSQLGYHGTQREANAGLWQRWGFERDGSVTGGEIVSPVLFDRPEDWAEIATVCRIVKSHGGVVNTTTGCHVHVGVGDFGTTPEAHNALLGEMRDNEDLVYRIAQRPGAGRHRMNQYCAPAHIPPEGYGSVTQVRSAQGSHYRPMNFAAVSGQPSDHVELRVWDGTLDPGAIQAQVAISVGMVEAARAGRTCPPEHASGLAGDHRAANAGRRVLRGEEWDADTTPFRAFADRVLATPEAKAQAAALYAASRWSAPSRYERRRR